MNSSFFLSALDRYPARFLVLFVTYTALAYVGLNWALVHGAGSPIWPAAGVGLAGLMLGGVRLWPAILLGRFSAALLSGSQQPLWVDALVGAGNALGAAIPVLIIGRWGGPRFTMHSLAGVLRYIFVGALIGASISSALGTAILSLSNKLEPAAASALFFKWSTGAFVGAVTVGPLILAWSEWQNKFTPRQWFGFLALLVGTTAVSLGIFDSAESEYLRTWHCLPVLIVAGLAFNVRGASAALIIIAATATSATTQGLGPFVQLARDSGEQIFLMQQFIATIALTSLVLSVVTDERRAKDALAAREQYLRIAEEDSRARAEELEVVLGAVPAMILVARDPDCREMTANRFGSRILRLPDQGGNMSSSLESSEALPRFQMLDPAGHKIEPEDMPVQRAARGETIHDFEGRVVFDDGSSKDFLGGATPLYTAAGNLRGAVGAFVDITERKIAEGRAALLAREVDHRAKNIMAVVQSIVQLTKAEDIESFREAVIGRIRSLARTHSLLAENRWDGAKLHEILNDEIAAYGHAGDESRIKSEGPDFSLLPAAAQSFALVVHELVTNAAKYGALSVSQGRVCINWGFEGTAQERLLHLQWSEQNGPAVSSPDRSGFGWTLIRATIEQQLRGRLQTRWQHTGLVVDITVPINDQPQSDPAQTKAEVPGNRIVQAPSRIRPLILVLDDEPLIGMQLEQDLQEAGYDVLGPVHSVTKALALITNHKPDAALLDINLRGEKSIAVADALQSKGVPFIFCTGFGDTSDLPEPLRSAGTLSKPIDQQMLRSALKSLLPNAPS